MDPGSLATTGISGKSIFGDAKTIENMAKFVRDMQDRKISYSVANIQGEVFLQAVTVIMDLSGNWHTRLNIFPSRFTMCTTLASWISSKISLVGRR